MRELFLYRVWPDGTVQSAQEPPYDWMSDDYTVVLATDEDAARLGDSFDC